MKKYRNEWKFCCYDAELYMIKERLSAVLEIDSNADEAGEYIVHSLYFDDYKDTCARDNEAGLSKRFKYRIRYYGDNINTIHLERKEKLNGRCYKSSYRLTLEEYNCIVQGNVQKVFWNTDNKLLKQFCIDMMTKLFKPKIIVDYERLAYVETITNIRITIDKNISVSNDCMHFLDRNYISIPLQEKNKHILEVKFDYILPGYIKKLISDNSLQQSSFSKYYLGRKKLNSLGGY